MIVRGIIIDTIYLKISSHPPDFLNFPSAFAFVSTVHNIVVDTQSDDSASQSVGLEGTIARPPYTLAQ